MHRCINCHENSGRISSNSTVSKCPYPVEKAFRLINEPVKLFICHLIPSKPGIFLKEIANEVRVNLGVEVSEKCHL